MIQLETKDIVLGTSHNFQSLVGDMRARTQVAMLGKGTKCSRDRDVDGGVPKGTAVLVPISIGAPSPIDLSK
jgi:hypothetical protein